MQLTAPLASLALLLLSAACSPAKDEASNIANSNATDVSPPPDLANTATNDTAPTLAAPPAPAPAANCPEGASCFGSLVVRPENMVLSRDRPSSLLVRGVVSLENRGDGPIGVAMPRAPIMLNLDNGSQVNSFYGKVSGIEICGRNEQAQACFDRSAGNFATLSNSDSPTKVNITMTGRYDPSLEPTVPTIEKGVLTFGLFTAPAGEAARALQVSVDQVPIRNQLAR